MLLQTEPAIPSMVAFLLVIGVWALSDWSIALRYRTSADAAQDQGSKRVIGVAIIVGILTAVLASVLVPPLRIPRYASAFWGGLALIVVGVTVRQYAVWTLGDAFSLEVRADPTDKLIDSGPYRWVRHPSYTGALLSLLGLGIAIGNWIGLVALLGAGLAGYGYRIAVEERTLRETLGDSYVEYENRTPYRLVPLLW